MVKVARLILQSHHYSFKGWIVDTVSRWDWPISPKEAGDASIVHARPVSGQSNFPCPHYARREAHS